LEYGQLEPFVRDVRRCFTNAKLYNPSTNHVHKVTNGGPLHKGALVLSCLRTFGIGCRRGG
jgi:hypothetical protein